MHTTFFTASFALVLLCFSLNGALAAQDQDQKSNKSKHFTTQQTTAHNATASVTVPPSPNSAFSFAQACKEDAHRLCSRQQEAVPECLSAKRGQVMSNGCKVWISAWDRCSHDVEKSGCAKTLTYCLKKVLPEKLSEECKETKLYRSIMLWTRARALRAKQKEKESGRKHFG